ncbi:MAG: hypothetical protein ACK4FB_08915 [Brevundimonas sp.]|uniref:hypothetical protein n=1 Tax=Brevundimonas sp. TaxID=1871086 RepID=UPI00391DFCD8
MTPVNLNAVKWRQLCDQAEQAALLRQPNTAADELAKAAGRLTTVTPPHESMADTALATAFRWSCTAFGLADPGRRSVLAAGLVAQAALVRRMVDPDAPEAAEALAVPTLAPEEPPAWTQRADIGG